MKDERLLRPAPALIPAAESFIAASILQLLQVGSPERVIESVNNPAHNVIDRITRYRASCVWPHERV